MEKYDFKKGLLKGVKFFLTALAGLAVISGFADITIWELLEKYLKPVLGALSVGGLITIVQNFIKVKFGGFRRLGQTFFK